MAKRKWTARDLKDLTEVFRAAGAEDPEGWARSQLEEGIPQLWLFSLAKALWEGVVDEKDTSWIEASIDEAKRDPGTPLAGGGLALREMLSKGVDRRAIVDLVRVVQYEALFHAASVLDRSVEPGVPVSDWGVFRVDEEERPIESLSGVSEILLGLDPTGREMRPRPR